MYLDQQAIDGAIATMSNRAYQKLGMTDFVFDDPSKSARKRWGRLTNPEQKGFALALFYKPVSAESRLGCCQSEEIDSLRDEVSDDWLGEMVLLPVKWSSLTDPLTLGLPEGFMGPYDRTDPDVVQATLRFPHVDIEANGYTSPLGGSEALSLNPFGTMYVWHLTPVSEDEAALWAEAYNAAETATDYFPATAYNMCCGDDVVNELCSPDAYEEWKGQSDIPPVCGSAHEDDVWGIGGDSDMLICSCCAYWELRMWLVETQFPSMTDYTNLARRYLGESLYDARWNEAAVWFRTGLDVAHDMTHIIASEGGSAWASWWESRFLPEVCFGGANALPLAHQRFALLASSA